MTALVLMGGGLDSTAAMLHTRNHRDVAAIFFKYGQKAWRQELGSVSYFCTKYDVPLTVVEVPINQIAESRILIDSDSQLNKLEGRNVIFVMMAATYAARMGYGQLVLGYHDEPFDAPFPDATQRAVFAMQNVLDMAYSSPIAILTPFGTMARTDVVRFGNALDSEFLTHTHTCYEGIDGGCGSCVHCRQRAVMIANLASGQNDPLPENK